MPERKPREFRGGAYYYFDGHWYDFKTNMQVPSSLDCEITKYFADKGMIFKRRKLKKKMPPIFEDWEDIPIMYRGGAPGLGKRK
jgi:hypothetical protein